jgi:hypothetical protein
MKTLWIVDHPESDLTVIAESAEDAMSLAIEGGFIEPEDAGMGEPMPYESRRWVQLEGADDRDDLLRDLERAGVDITRILLRTWEKPGAGAHLWEIGASDADWCRLDEGVLCGGWS